ncbi:MAG: OadG family protein [Kiritimatiellae bacterium]|nr:OadG family protein [Kiritimatiellia bacterium]
MAIMGQGIVLMIAGMGIVYVFLYIMIIVCEKASKLVSKFDYLVPDEPKKVRKAPAPAASASAPVAKVAAPSEGTQVTAPVPGMVLRITAQNGQEVAKDDEILVMDVMKMETPITAPCAGKVSILVAQTDKVATGDVLAVVG